MPTPDRLQEEHDEDARALCAQAGMIASLEERLRLLERWQSGVEILSQRQWRVQLLVMGAAFTLGAGLASGLILLLVKR